MIRKIKDRFLFQIDRTSFIGNIILSTYRRLYIIVAAYKYAKAETLTWLIAGRHYDSRIRPIDIIYINPNCIDSRVKNHIARHPKFITEVIDGDWSSYIGPIEERSSYRSFKQRFLHDAEWEDTEFFNRVSKLIVQGKTKWGCTSVQEFKLRCDQLDNLYNSISKQGYKTQRELINNKKDPIIKREQRFGPELQEVAVCIDKDGKIHFYDGRHRFYMAKIAGIEKIPVRVKARHKKWQLYRDKISNGQKPRSDHNKHPDLQDCI